MATELSHSVSDAESGIRLDALVARILGCGIRPAKRLAAAGLVTVNGKICPPHYKLRPGNRVAVRRDDSGTAAPPLRLAAVGKDFLAFIKPPGLHTARIAGSAEDSLEESIALQWEYACNSGLLPENTAIPEALRAALGNPSGESTTPSFPLPPEPPELLSRLDAPTSGLVAAAFSPESAERFRAMEAAGLVDKFYLAVVHGRVTAPFAITNELDTDSRKKTRVLAALSGDAIRHTAILPLGEAPGYSIPGTDAAMTLVAARIKRGMRHQIRAHLAHAGFPILGDALYGTEAAPRSLYLHHARLALPEFSAFCQPPWLHFPQKTV